jgi:hypothetical protein
MKRPLVALAAVLAATACGSGAMTPAASTTPSSSTAPASPPAGSTAAQPSTPTSAATTKGSGGGPPGSTGPTGTSTTAPAPLNPPTSTAGPAGHAGAASGGLTVSFTTSTPTTAPGTTVKFTLTATETQAKGALGYRVAYGDGATEQNAVPQFCLAGPGTPQTSSWQLAHAYAKPGTYTVTVTVAANCTPDQATTSLPETVS